MWLSMVENKNAVISIYKALEPSLNHLFLQELNVFTGDDIRVTAKIDLSELPEELPLKWKINKVNTVQIIFDFIGVDFQSFLLTNTNYKNGYLIIEDKTTYKHIIYYDELGNEVLNLKTKWIYIKTITGYFNNKTTD
jgi:hypothetical protein